MKKIILSLVFIFTMGTSFMNATNDSTQSLVLEIDCTAMAFDAEKRAGKEFSYETFNAIVEACEASQELQVAP